MLKYSGPIQAQWDGIKSKEVVGENRNHSYFRRLYLGGHAKMGNHWGGDIVMDVGASTVLLRNCYNYAIGSLH